MLTKLIIKNYALIDEMSIVFSGGLNIITGETGAGKSIILGALGLILGDRAKTDVIRHGENNAMVEGIFVLSKTDFLKDFENDFDLFGNELIIRREVHESGRSRAFINDTPVSLQTLSEVGDRLIDLHGQHAHQSLLKVDHHIDFVDNFNKNEELLNSVANEFRRLKALHDQLANLNYLEQNTIEKKDLYAFHLSEINSINPGLDEEEQLIQDEKILKNGERILQSVSAIKNVIYDGNDSAIDNITFAEKTLSNLVSVDEKFHLLQTNFESARLILDDGINQLEDYVSKIDFDSQQLETMRERILQLQGLKKKFGGSIQTVLEYRNKIQNELNQMNSYDEEKAKLVKSIDSQKNIFREQCLKLSDYRKQNANELKVKVISALSDLGMPNSQFDIRFSATPSSKGYIQIDGMSVDATERGIDKIEFFISTNPGEPLKPLAQTASGGEISRIMLALKSVLADSDSVPILVFDEIDTGISGRIADVVGRGLKALATRHQIVCITHLPQIASKGEVHFSVEKRVKDNKTSTIVRLLDEELRLHAIAQLLGGETVTENTLENAKELLNQD